MVSDRVKGHGEPGFGPRSVEVVAARCSGAWAYLRHAAAAGDMKPCGHDHRELTHLDSTTPGGGSCRYCELPDGRGPISRRVTGEAADLAVAQPVVDERQQLAGGGDAADVATPSGTDASFDRGDLRVADRTGDRFDGSPAQQPGALLGDPAAGDVAVGLAVARSQPGPRTQPPWVGEPASRRRSRRRTRRRTPGRPHVALAPPHSRDDPSAGGRCARRSRGSDGRRPRSGRAATRSG